MNQTIVILSLISLFLSACAPPAPEGYWMASPSEKSSATSIRILNIVDKKYSHLSEDISLFTNLERLVVQNDGLEEVPSYIEALKKLQRLDVSQNKLTDLPLTIKELKNLKELNLSANQLTSLPPAVLLLENLEVLDLRENDLSELPQDLTKLKKLNAIYIGGNNFTKEQRRLFRKQFPYTKIIVRSKKG